MALKRNNSKEWRRSRSQSFLDNLTTPPSSPARRPPSVVSRRTFRIPPRFRISATLILATGTILCWVLLFHSGQGQPSQIHLAKDHQQLQHPNFDFDLQQAGNIEQDEEEHPIDEEEHALSHSADDDGEAEAEHDDDGDQNEPHQQQVWTEVIPSSRRDRSQSLSSVPPFLPYSCASCTSTSPFNPSSPTCVKYGPHSSTSPQISTISSPLRPDILDDSILFAGTGSDVRRVLKRAFKSHLYGMKRENEGKEDDSTKFEDEEPFRILVLGGSVSNCRGVDPKSTCWHSQVLRWFQETLPMEGDRDFVPKIPSLLTSTIDPNGPFRLDDTRARVKRAAIPLDDSDDILSSSSPPTEPRRRVKRAIPRSNSRKKKKKTKKKKSTTSTNRRKPSTRLINGSKSATGSAFFAYCFEEEMTLRRKNVDWGKGPDLIVLEYGVNDVYPHDEVATRDFEKLLRTLRSLPSNPAVVALEAASLLLASTTTFTSNAEYLHLPAAQFYDVPVLSAKNALFGSRDPFSSPPSLKMKDMFLPDQHHPNDRGHEFLADILISYLEQQACIAQAEILEHASSRISRSSSSSHSALDTDLVVSPDLDIARRKEEIVRPLPTRSLFTPFPVDAKDVVPWDLPNPRCLQVGNSKSTVEPIRNNGWEKYAWARDKQYLVAEKPGSSVTYRVEVGSGGTVMADWLRSRFYDLGDVSVYLDEDRTKAVNLAGYWNLGWSIGVPTEIFTGIAAGPHEVTFELLPSSRSSHPSKKTNFRLIGLITT